MPNEWELNLQKYNISKNRYLELKSKCKQYMDYKKAILIPNISEKEKNRCQRNIDAIELALHIALNKTPNFEQTYCSILKIITGQETLIKQQTYHSIQLSKNTYYKVRRLFYCELDKLVD